MKRKMAAVVVLATLFVSVPLVFEAVYRHVLPQLVNRESDTMINSVAVIYTAVIYLPVLAVVALLLWRLLRSNRPKPQPSYARKRYLDGRPSSDATPSGYVPRKTLTGVINTYLLAEEPDIYVALRRGKDRAGKRHDRTT